MARYGVLADIHGNREALTAVLARLQREGAERLVCPGDVVGYNADPDECVEILRQRDAVIIAGNHDLIGTGRLDFRRCTNKAKYSLKRTRRTLSSETVSFLQSLSDTHTLENQTVVLIHGGVRDVQQYMTTPEIIGRNAAFLREDFPQARVCFFGHSHQQKVYEVDGDTVTEIPAGGRIFLQRDKTYFVNPGAVDASRKTSSKLAECAVFDSSDWSIEFLRTPYDCASTEAKAAVFGYRINPLTDRFYTLTRTLARRLRFA
jgi:predicted phosphodiesterase